MYIECYKTSDLVEIAALKNFLEEKEIPYYILNENWSNLLNSAIPFHEAVASFYVLDEDVEEFLKFIKNSS